MVEFATEYGKQNGSCGFRLQSEADQSAYWKPTIERMKMTNSLYYVY